MEALILGAGYATRLYPLTKDQPKPLLPVGGIPILERITHAILPIDGLRRVHLVTNHKFAGHFERWREGYLGRRPKPVEILVHDDQTTTPENRLGAIGDIRFVVDRAGIDDDLMIIAGDNILPPGVDGFVRYARSKVTAACLKKFETPELVSLYGAVLLDPAGRIIDFEEKPKKPKSLLVSIGLYHYGKPHVPLFRKYLEAGNNKDAPGYFLQWAHKQIDVYGYASEGAWFDIGDLESYKKADQLMKEGKL
jgi:glucose-1-phosphate thymidylyltransferase